MNVLKDIGKGFTELLAPDAQATINTYADVVGSKIDTAPRSGGSVAIALNNTDVANDLDWKILGSIDDDTYYEVVAEATVQEASSGTPYTISQAPYRYYKVQVKSTSGGNHAIAVVTVVAK